MSFRCDWLTCIQLIYIYNLSLLESFLQLLPYRYNFTVLDLTLWELVQKLLFGKWLVRFVKIRKHFAFLVSHGGFSLAVVYLVTHINGFQRNTVGIFRF